LECKNCGLWENAISNCIRGYGSSTPRVVFVGEAPGEKEDQQGIPFIGEAGDLLKEFIFKFNIPYEWYFLTNVCRCRPPSNRNPTKEERRACASYLFEELYNLKPEIIVPLGNVALEQIMGVTGIMSQRGIISDSDTYNCKVLPMLHPAAITRNPHRRPLMEKDFKTLVKFLEEGDTKPRRKTIEFGEIIVVNKQNRLPTIMKKGLKYGIMFWDVETNGKDVHDPELEVTCFSIACRRKEAYVFPLTSYSENGKHKLIYEFLALLLENEKVKKCAQNMNFDAKVMKLKYGVNTNNWWFDPMIAHFLISPVRGTHNQHAMTLEYLREEAGGYDDFVRAAGGAHRIEPGPELWRYNGLDSSVGFELMYIFEPILKERKQWRIFREVLMNVAPHLMDMEIKGMKFDVPYIEEVSKEYKEEMKKLQTLMDADEGIQEYEWKYGTKFNPRSPKDLPWLLFEYYQLPVLAVSVKTKKPSTKKEVMAQYAAMGNEFCVHLQKWRRLAKADSTYLEGIIKKLYGDISRTSFNLTIARSGRTTSGADEDSKFVTSLSFNMQNIPRDPKIKRIMVAREGHALVAGDLSQIELKILASLSKDDALLRAVEKDAHRGMGAEVFGVPYGDITSEQRRIGKTCNFAIVYLVSAEGLAPILTEETGRLWSVQEADDLIENLKSKFPTLGKWQLFCEWHIRKYGYVVSPLGRRRYFGRKDAKDIRDGTNTPIQGTASDFMLIGIINVKRLIEERDVAAYPINEVHDQIVLETPILGDYTGNHSRQTGLHVPESVITAGEVLQEAMLDMRWPVSGDAFKWLITPLSVDLEWGYNMGQLEPLELDWEV
jgi:DNA polymerase-1